MLSWIKSIGRKKLPSSGTKSSTKGNKAGTAASSVAQQARILTRAEHGISRKDIDKHALKVLYRLHKAGYHACLVGGAVRDLLLGVEPKDFDVATDATPEQVSKLFKNCRLIGRRFRLAHIHFGRQIIEVATFRAEHDLSSSGLQDESGRIMRDNVFGELADDVWRRDFTVNALYYDIADFSVIDFVGGFEDIQQRKLDLIGDVETRYREDPVRMLRAVRFSAKLDFEIESRCREPIDQLGALLEGIPPARLYEEALKLFHSGHAVKSFDLLLETDLLRYLFPAAAVAINSDPQFVELLRTAMKNTDTRIRNDQRVTPAFLFASLLWHAVSDITSDKVQAGMPASVAIQKAATQVLREQNQSISIPKRFTTVMRDIWGLQTRFHFRKGKRALAILEHKKFRAAYDFLCIRAQAFEAADSELVEDCKFWTEIQKLSPEKQKQALLSRQPPPKAAAKKRRRRRPKKKPAADASDH
jgi:poly(A) polymerase